MSTPAQPTTSPSPMSRGTFLRFAVAGVAVAAAGSSVVNAPGARAATGVSPAAGVGAVPAGQSRGGARQSFPVPGSGGIPAGPSTHGYLAGDLLAWSPEHDTNARHFRCLIPRAERIAPFAATQAHPTLDPSTQLLSLAVDYQGDVYEGRARPIGDEDQVYTQRYWPYIDIYGSWHGQLIASVPDDVVSDPEAEGRVYGVVDIPNPGWTEAAHKNGARTIGGWFWPREDDFDRYVQRDADGGYPVGRKLVEIKQYFGFDGYFINQEASITPEQITALFAMFRYMKSLDPDLYLQYYDAALPDTGIVDYQNEINEKNVGSLGTVQEPVADSIFVNYGWPYTDQNLTHSAATVARHGFDPKQTAFASTECQKGGFNPAEDFGSLATPKKNAPVSWALFVENEIWGLAANAGITDSAEGRARYRDYERKFWSGPLGDPSRSGRVQERRPPYRTDVLNYKRWDGVAHAIVEKSAISELPLRTTFNIGVGTHFAVDGQDVGAVSWNNAGIADVSPTWQYWTEQPGSADVAVELDESVAWEGGHSLQIAGSAPMHEPVVLHLFKTDLRPGHGAVASIRARGVGRSQQVEIGLIFRDEPDRPVWLRMHPHGRSERGWSRLEANLARFHHRRLARISLRFSGDRDGELDVHIGELLVGNAGHEYGHGDGPRRPAGFRIEHAKRAGGAAQAYFGWRLADDAYAYDVFGVGDGGRSWLGRVHRDVYFAEGIQVPADGRLQFELVPIAEDGARGRVARATATV